MSLKRREWVLGAGVAAAATAAGAGWALWRRRTSAPPGVEGELWSSAFDTPDGKRLALADHRGHLLVLNQALMADPPASLGYALAHHPALCALVAWTGLLFEFAFPLVLFSERARRALVPLAAVFHVANSLLFRIFFQNVWLLLLFVRWDALARRLRALRPAGEGRAARQTATSASSMASSSDASSFIAGAKP